MASFFQPLWFDSLIDALQFALPIWENIEHFQVDKIIVFLESKAFMSFIHINKPFISSSHANKFLSI